MTRNTDATINKLIQSASHQIGDGGVDFASRCRDAVSTIQLSVVREMAARYLGLAASEAARLRTLAAERKAQEEQEATERRQRRTPAAKADRQKQTRERRR